MSTRGVFAVAAVVVVAAFAWAWGYQAGERSDAPACVVVHSHTEAARVWLDGKTPCEGGR